MNQITITQLPGDENLEVELNCESRERAIEIVREVLIALTEGVENNTHAQI